MSARPVWLERGVLVELDDSDPGVQAERAALGALLADSERAWPAVSPLLVAQDFAHGPHAAIFGAIAKACAAGSAADPVTIANALTAGGVETGGVGYLATLAREVASVANAGAYAELVRTASLRRRVAIELKDRALQLTESGRPPAEILAELQRFVTDCIERGTARSDIGMLEASRLAIDDFDRRLLLRESGELAGISTGLPRLDRMMGGFEPGLIVLAALTSVGKTAMAWNVLLGAALRGVPCGIVSLEMSALELARRAYSRVHGISLGDLMRGDPAAFTDLIECERGGPLSRLPVRVDDNASTIEQVVARISTWHARYGIRLAAVDYLQLITAGNAQTRQLEVARVSRELKRLALRLRIPIIALSQFSRAAAAASSNDERPELHHLRDSGSVEQDADVVMVLWRSTAQREADAQDRPRQSCLTILKSRNGLVGDAYSAKSPAGPLMFEASLQRFREYSSSDGIVDGGESPKAQARSASAYANAHRQRAAGSDQ